VLRILVIGSGAREHALTWKFSKSKRTSALYVAPGNAGTEQIATNVPELGARDYEGIVRFSIENRINLVFIGPEDPLADGLADILRNAGIPAIGPGKEAAQLEGSKAFAKNFMRDHGIPTARSAEFDSYEKCVAYLEKLDHRVVLKKSGLAAGKGVLESTEIVEMKSFAKSVLTNDTLLVEEYLAGYEVSIFAVSDGENYLLLPPCADYKKAGEGTTGPNTGGLGSVCPVPWIEPAMLARIKAEVVEPTFQGLRTQSLRYKGILYFGLMITDEGPRLLEYNVRFGDPETQVLLPLIKSDFGNLCDAIIEGNIGEFPLAVSEKSAVGVVIASPGYPGQYRTGLPVRGLPSDSAQGQLVFHANTHRDNGGVILTGGGRSFTAVGIGNELLQARAEAYSAAQAVKFDGAWFRKDIGSRIFGN